MASQEVDLPLKPQGMDSSKCKRRLNLQNISISDYSIEFITINAPIIKEMYGIDELPLKRASVRFAVNNVSTAVANSIRRVLVDEIHHYMLMISNEDVVINATYDNYMSYEYVNGRLNGIPVKLSLDPEIAENVYFSISAENRTEDNIDVLSGAMMIHNTDGYKLKRPIFNPSFQIASLRPGHTLNLTRIRLVRGMGMENSNFQCVSNAISRPTDIETYSYEEIVANHKIQRYSKYKQSCLVADPCMHEVLFNVKAVYGKDDINILIEDVFKNLVERFRTLLNDTDLEKHVTVISEEYKQLKIELEETATISHVLMKCIYDLTTNQVKDVKYVIDITSGVILFTLVDSDPIKLYTEGINYAISIYNQLLASMKKLT